MLKTPRLLTTCIVALSVAACADQELPSAPAFRPQATEVALPPLSHAGARFFNIVDEQGNTIWQNVADAPHTQGSFTLRYWSPVNERFQECRLVPTDTYDRIFCDWFLETWFDFEYTCPNITYPIAATYILDNYGNKWSLGLCFHLTYSRLAIYPGIEGVPFSVTAAPTAPGGLVFKRWEITFAVPGEEGTGSGQLAVCAEPAGLTCTVTTPADGLRPYFTLVYGAGFDFSGFLAPLRALPMVNTAKAGSAVPVRFDLGGDHGLDILAGGYPSSRQIPCDLAQESGAVVESASAGRSGLSYDAETGLYTYVWKTEKSWANTCRSLTVQLADGSSQSAEFRFTR